VAGANYEVNIQLKADPALKALERIEKKINGLTKSSVDLQDARGAAMVKNRNLADRINKLEEKGVNIAKMRDRLNRAIEKTDKGKLQTAAAHEKILRREIKAEEKLLQVKKDQLKVDRQQPRRKGPSRASGAVLGGGFPLLFGGSPFQALGGAVGGALGGFAGGIGAQVAVAQIENLFVKAAQLGQGLSELNFDLQGVTEAAGFAGTETAQLLERIEQYGDAAVAARLATKLLEKRIGVGGVKALKDFGEKANELGRALSTIFTQVLAGIAKAAGPLLDFLAKFAGEQAAVGSFKARTDLAAGSREEFAQQVLTGSIGGQGRGGKRARLLARAQELGLDLTTEGQIREFARQTALKSQKQFELPTIKEIEFQASQVQDPSQRAAANKAGKEAERKQLKEFLALNKEITRDLDRRDEINAMEGKHIASQLDAADQITQKQDARKAKLEGSITGTEREAALNQRINDIKQKGLLPADEARLIAAEKQIDAMDQQAEAAKKIEAQFEQVGKTVKSGIVNGIMAAIDGAKSLQESLASILRDVGRIFLNLAISQAGSALKIPGFADGGYVSGPTAAVVGEGGESEYIIPESKMRESMSRYSRGARGASVIPETSGSGTSGEGGGTAVASPIDVRYTVERINSVDYVTAEQFQRGLQSAAAQGAKQGEQQTLKRLQLSGSTRKRIGL
jgi:hypothetical protein